jgi:tripartite-type tricarboxylate transporter receptor subunit TctC
MAQARLTGFKALLLIMAAAMFPASSIAQAYPTKPVHMLVGWSPGGGVDVTSRILADKLSLALAQRIIVENRPGAGGNIAGALAAKAAPDGYTILIGTNGELAINASLFKSPGFHPIDDFSHIAMAVRVPIIMVAHPSVPASDVRSVIDYSKKQPNGLVLGSPGNGSLGHLIGELLRTTAGAKILHVPYKGAAPAITDLVGGQVQMVFSSMPAVLPHLRSGRLKALAVTTEQRVEAVRDLPTVAEAGFPGITAFNWYAVVGPAGMPQAIVAKLNDAFKQVLSDPEIKAKLVEQGLESWPMSPQEVRSYMQSEVARWEKVVRTSGTKID